MKHEKIPHCGNNSKIKYQNCRKRHRFDTHNTQIHDGSLSWLYTDTSIKSGRVKLVLWALTSPLSDMKRSCKYIPHVSKIPTLTYNGTNSVIIIILNKNDKLLNEHFHLGSCNLECVKHYKYPGIIISASGKFTEAKTQLHNKALKATFKLYKDLKTTEPSVSTLLHSFDHMIKPIVLYGCEIWGTLINATLQKTTDIYDLFKEWEFEKLNTKFCKVF